MTIDQHIHLFVQQAAWLEAETCRELARPLPRMKRILDIRARNLQLNREFERFKQIHEI